jgi:transcriptional regulator NrdR family protein
MMQPDKGELKRGLECSRCGCTHFYTTHTEPVSGGRIRRRRECRNCGRRIVTYEMTAQSKSRSD